MSIRIKFFGPLADVVGRAELVAEVFADTDVLRGRMLNDFPGLKGHQFVMAVDKQIIRRNTELKEGNVVALLPPFAGG